MLTPYFSLTQTDDDINLFIRAPLANVAKTELSVEDDVIIFYSSPYYLRLHLPGKVIERENDTGQYCCDKQEFYFKLKKASPGEHFEDLDMLGKLLIPNKKYHAKPEISVLNDLPEEVVPSSDPESDDEQLGYIEQEVCTEKINQAPGYGFANKGHGMGAKLGHEFREILDLVDIENTAVNDRQLVREADEHSRFSEDYYLADYMETQEIDDIISWVPEFKTIMENNETVKLTKEDKEALKTLGNRDYLLENHEKKIALFSLVDILFAYAYDHRTSKGEESVESAWTINKLSATLSWFQSYQNMREVKTACARRSLIFPLYRNWKLTKAVFEDTTNILKLGRRMILKCLIHIHKMFNASEPRYLLNSLYIIDYCIWLQKVSDKKIKHLLDLFDECEISKSDVGLELEELEEAALLVKEEEELEIVKRLQGVQLSESEYETGTSDLEDESEEDIYSSPSEKGSSSNEASTDSSLDSDDDSSDEN